MSPSTKIITKISISLGVFACLILYPLAHNAYASNQSTGSCQPNTTLHGIPTCVQVYTNANDQRVYKSVELSVNGKVVHIAVPVDSSETNTTQVIDTLQRVNNEQPNDRLRLFDMIIFINSTSVTTTTEVTNCPTTPVTTTTAVSTATSTHTTVADDNNYDHESATSNTSGGCYYPGSNIKKTSGCTANDWTEPYNNK